ncbi:hypothetical protein GCM10010425_49390 [Streptomyces spororaveus]|uniref:DDE family transposase n=1 Tax=Streptomyces spororaveus TaxID=284039 RepID=A0ABQ3T2C7_9ACTN|nr:hypothetical protein Sspor_00940 [Streptomyces spororaveus]
MMRRPTSSCWETNHWLGDAIRWMEIWFVWLRRFVRLRVQIRQDPADVGERPVRSVLLAARAAMV